MPLFGAHLRSVRSWIVKGRPSENDFAAMRAGVEEVWHTRKPPRDWSLGDAVFVWCGAPALRLTGTATITQTDPAAPGALTFFTLRYTSDPLATPLTVHQLRADPALANASFLKSGPPGRSSRFLPSQAARLEELVAPPTPKLALSLRQPWAELILRGIKTLEVRSTRTHKRERVLIYASKGGVTADEEMTVTRRYHLDVPGLPRGRHCRKRRDRGVPSGQAGGHRGRSVSYRAR